MANKALKVNPSLSLVAQSTAPSDPNVNEIYNDASSGLLRWTGSAWVALSSGGGGSGIGWSGYHQPGTAGTWSLASTTYVDFSLVAGAVTLTERVNVGFGSVVTAAGNLPGITFASTVGASYRVIVHLGGYTDAGAVFAYRLVDGTGTTVIDESDEYQVAPNTGVQVPLSGLYVAAATSVTIKIQGLASAGTEYISYVSGSVPAISWTITRLS